MPAAPASTALAAMQAIACRWLARRPVRARGRRHPHAGLGAGPGSSSVDAGLGLLVAVAGGQHHAFADAKLHLARRQVGDQHGELARQLLGLYMLAMPLNTLRFGPLLARVQGQLQQLGEPSTASHSMIWRCADPPWRSRRW